MRGALILTKKYFLEELRQFKCLWDINVPSYKERPTKNNAWQMLAQLFNRDGKN